MKSLFTPFLLVLSLTSFASPAMASFARSSCSSADGSIRYEFSMAWNQPRVTKWIINNRAVSVNESLIERSMSQVLEENNSPMVHASTTVEKVTLKKSINSDEVIFSTWWICSGSAGI